MAKQGLYEQLVSLGCSTPLQCAKEVVQHGVTKFFNRNYTEVTLRLEADGTFKPTWRVPARDQGGLVQRRIR